MPAGVSLGVTGGARVDVREAAPSSPPYCLEGVISLLGHSVTKAGFPCLREKSSGESGDIPRVLWPRWHLLPTMLRPPKWTGLPDAASVDGSLPRMSEVTLL